MIGSDAKSMRGFLHSLIDWSSVQCVLDLGCGTGYDLHQIGKLTSAQALLVGIDSSRPSIEQAIFDARQDSRFSFSVTDIATRLPFPDQHFDVVFSNNVLECISEKPSLLREVDRILKQDGQFLCAHFDWDSQLINGSNKPLIRKIVHAFADWQQPWMRACDGWMGRRLWPAIEHTGLFAGSMVSYVLTNTVYEPSFYGYERIQDFAYLVEAGQVEAREYQSFLGDIADAATKGQYFYSITMYAYLGRKKTKT